MAATTATASTTLTTSRRRLGRPGAASSGWLTPSLLSAAVEPGRGRAPAGAPGGGAEPSRLGPLRAAVTVGGVEHGGHVAAALDGQARGHELAAAAVLGGGVGVQ